MRSYIGAPDTVEPVSRAVLVNDMAILICVVSLEPGGAGVWPTGLSMLYIRGTAEAVSVFKMI